MEERKAARLRSALEIALTSEFPTKTIEKSDPQLIEIQDKYRYTPDPEFEKDLNEFQAKEHQEKKRLNLGTGGVVGTLDLQTRIALNSANNLALRQAGRSEPLN
ncbi:MAG TPA: hypothetical protein VKC54_00015 [Patescibacteria group bacterium]|nr:hypothetical protein [Patescibacteria group bacterium]